MPEPGKARPVGSVPGAVSRGRPQRGNPVLERDRGRGRRRQAGQRRIQVLGGGEHGACGLATGQHLVRRRALGRRLARLLHPGDVVLLQERMAIASAICWIWRTLQNSRSSKVSSRHFMS